MTLRHMKIFTCVFQRCRVERDVLERRFAEVESSLGMAKVKVCRLPDGSEVWYLEYESVKELARKSGKGYSEVYREIKIVTGR